MSRRSREATVAVRPGSVEDQALALEQQQGLPHGFTGYPEARREFFLLDAGTWKERAAQDRPADLVCGAHRHDGFHRDRLHGPPIILRADVTRLDSPSIDFPDMPGCVRVERSAADPDDRTMEQPVLR